MLPIGIMAFVNILISFSDLSELLDAKCHDRIYYVVVVLL